VRDGSFDAGTPLRSIGSPDGEITLSRLAFLPGWIVLTATTALFFFGVSVPLS